MLARNEFVYSRERRRFGRQCAFTDRNQLMLSINPSRRERLQYILRNPVDEETQLSEQKAFSVMETENVTFGDHGMFHYEGGWPKEVNINDEESTLRYRKKIERDDNWGPQVLGLLNQSFARAEENTSINIYQDFFIELPAEDVKASFEARQKNIFHDPEPKKRPITVIDWAPSDVHRFLLLHTNIPYQRELPEELLNIILAQEKERRRTILLTSSVVQKAYKKQSDRVVEANNFYIWNMENPLKPVVIFKNHEKVLKAFYCPKDEAWIAGGLFSGKVCIWDSRKGLTPVSLCSLEVAHREAVSALCWVHSKSNTEFYTGSYDGSVKYWDGRDLETPLQEILLDPEMTDEQSRKRAHGATVLEFEYTIPIRFIVGSDMGSIFIGNRKGMTPMETFASGNYRLFNGPIRTVERNPFFVKNFLITGDWCAKVWAEECKGAPTTLLVKKNNQILCGSWSTSRCSLFVTGDSNGELDFWDLLLHQRKPIFSMKFECRISYVKFRPDGEYLAVCLENGDLHILELDEALKQCTSKDKALIGAMFEREQLRCKFLEGRVEEIKLRHRLTFAEEERKASVRVVDKEEEVDTENADEFLRMVTVDLEFRAALKSFQQQVLKVEKKRASRIYVMEKCDFDEEEPPPPPVEEEEQSESEEVEEEEIF